MLKKDIKNFFKVIRDRDLSVVRDLVNSNLEYLKICNIAPPKKDDGQSGLQVAFKTGNFDIAKFLIEKGADVNFMEISEINEWTAPVLHDSIRSVIFNSYTLQKEIDIFETAFSLLQLMLDSGANPNSTDSYGNNCLHRAILDSNQMIDHPGADLSSEILIKQLKRVFQALILAGADVKQSSGRRPSAESMVNNFRLQKYQLW